MSKYKKLQDGGEPLDGESPMGADQTEVGENVLGPAAESETQAVAAPPVSDSPSTAATSEVVTMQTPLVSIHLAQDAACPVCSSDLVRPVVMTNGTLFHECVQCETVWLPNDPKAVSPLASVKFAGDEIVEVPGPYRNNRSYDALERHNVFANASLVPSRNGIAIAAHQQGLEVVDLISPSVQLRKLPTVS